MSALDTIVTIVNDADKAFDAAAPLLGVGEFVPLVDALTALLNKVQSAANSAATTLDAEVAGADAAAKAAEAAAGLK